jgi:hypothetical protein
MEPFLRTAVYTLLGRARRWVVTLQDVLWLSFGAILGVSAAASLAIIPDVFRWLRATAKSVATKWESQDRIPPT